MTQQHMHSRPPFQNQNQRSQSLKNFIKSQSLKAEFELQRVPCEGVTVLVVIHKAHK